MQRFATTLACLCLLSVGLAEANTADTSANPIRKVVTLLQEMQKELEATGKKEQELYDKFMCYCETTAADLAKASEESDAQMKDLSATLEEDKSEKTQLDAELAEHKSDRDGAKADLAKATAIRGKEASEYAELKKDSEANIAALGGSIPAIEKGMGGSALVQVPNKDRLKKLVESSKNVNSFDRDRVLSFLSGKATAESGDDYAPASGQIVGILKSMKDDMEKDLGEATSDENNALAAFDDLKSAKSTEIQTSTDAIEAKGTRSGALAVTIVQATSALDDATAEKADADKYSVTLKAACEEKSKEWTARRAMRAEEVSAISEAVTILNDDDALDIFKKALPSALVETTSTESKRRQMGFLAVNKGGKAGRLQKAQAIVDSATKIYKSTALELLSYNLKSALKQGSKQPAGQEEFGTVTHIIDDMISVMEAEGEDDEKHRDNCKEELATNESEKASVQDTADNVASTVSELTDSIKTTADDIATLGDEITKLDASVALATVNRKTEHAEYTEALTLNEAAVQLIGKAKNRLQKFYNPALHKPEPKEELSAEDRIYSNLGGEAASLIQISKHTAKVAPPVAPETWGAYQPAGGKSGGVMALMDMLVQELKSDMQAAKHDEETAQRDYDNLMAESRTTRQQNSKSIVDKEATKSELEAKLEEAKENQALTADELNNINQYLSEVHNSCDFLLQNYDLRREARHNEIESLKNAKAVLMGAKFD